MNFAHMVLDAVFESEHALSALFCFPGEDIEVDGVDVRVALTSEDVAGGYGGLDSVPVDQRVVIEIRSYEEGLGGGKPAEGSTFKISEDSSVMPGEVFEVDREPLRLDSARLVWSCTVERVPG